MELLYPGVYKLLPSKVTPTKYISFFVEHPAGNLLIPCYAKSSTLDAHFPAIIERGGLTRQLLGDSHFRTAYCDVVATRFNAPLYCSEPEAEDVRRSVQQVVTFPMQRHWLAHDVEVIPTPGHRPGGVCYRITVQGRRYLFAGDFIWHTAEGWMAFPSKGGREQLYASLESLADLDFDVLLANSQVDDPVCAIEFTPTNRLLWIADLLDRVKQPR
jgi:hydroxyacylglutathione hydrolase